MSDFSLFVRELTEDYLRWVASMFEKDFNLDLKNLITEYVDADIQDLSKYFPPQGRLLLCKFNTTFVGMVRLRKIREEVGEVKNMYVRPEFQGRGIGRILLEHLIKEAKSIGSSKLRLDTGPFMNKAQDQYHSVGFYNISPYPESDIIQIDDLESVRSKWIFMEMKL
ncbi:MAG: GNAT family N-acetyltransferase [Promethearchaeota archaeon]|jgi:ribosomal protein S18 acetylase RimI-like enzyme